MTYVERLEPRQLLASIPDTFGGNAYDVGFQTKVDSGGNTVVAGIFTGTADFDPKQSVTFNLTSAGETDGFVAKYAPDGTLVWAYHFGGGAGKLTEKQHYSPIEQTIGEYANNAGPNWKGAGEYVSGLAIGSDDSIYVAGAFLGTANFDPEGSGYNVKSAGNTDIYLLKLNSDGSFAWARGFGGIFEDTAKAVALDDMNNPVVTGRFTRSADFNPTKSGVLQLDALGRDDCFVMYVSSAGKIVWAERFGSTAIDYSQRDSGEDVMLDSDNNIYVTGSFARTPDFDPGPGQFPITSYGNTDVFLLKLTIEGASVFASHVGGSYHDGGRSIALGPDGSIYTAGYFSRSANLDPNGTLSFVAPKSETINGTQTDIFVSRLTSDGELIWVNQLLGAGYELMGRMVVDSSGTVLITGAFAGQVTLNPTASSPTVITGVLGVNRFPDNKNRKYSYDIFAAAYDGDGDLTQYAQFGSTSDDYGIGVALNASDTPVLVGRFKGTVNFGTSSSPVNKKSRGDSDVYALLDPPIQDVTV